MRSLVRSLLLLLALVPSVAWAQPLDGICDDESGNPALEGLGDFVDDTMDAAGVTVAPDGYVRNTTSERPAASLEEAAARAERLAVPHRVQEGPTCGLYALGMVMDFWHAKDARNASPYVVAKDRTRAGAATMEPTTDKLLFDTAKSHGYFAESRRIVNRDGGMFVADQLGRLATKFGYDYRRIDRATAADVRAVVDRGNPALVGFDVDLNGNPTSVAGKRAHWGVVVGHFEYEGEQWFVAQHGWEAKTYLWEAKALERSMNQIQDTLGPKIIEVFPKAPSSVAVRPN